MLDKELFYTYLNEEKPLNDGSLHHLQRVAIKYPYFQTAKLLLLKNMKHTEHPEYMTELKNVAITCSDRQKLFYFLNDDRFARFFPKTESRVKNDSDNDRTELLLDSFLESIEKDDDEKIVTTKIENQWESNSIISTDYLAYLEKAEPEENRVDHDEEAKPMKHQELLDSFLEKSSGDEALFSNRNRTKDESSELSQSIDNLLDDDTFLTETLAQVYIKQKKYEQALTIIKRLSLNFPKKSIYFADQIRFLEYLIYNDKNKKQK